MLGGKCGDLASVTGRLGSSSPGCWRTTEGFQAPRGVPRVGWVLRVSAALLASIRLNWSSYRSLRHNSLRGAEAAAVARIPATGADGPSGSAGIVGSAYIGRQTHPIQKELYSLVERERLDALIGELLAGVDNAERRRGRVIFEGD
jgi:hypothetical protein